MIARSLKIVVLAMRLREFNLDIFLGMLEALRGKVGVVEVEAAEWKTYKKGRDLYGDTGENNSYYIAKYRSNLEEALEALRYELASCYDFIHERGLVEHSVAVARKDQLKEQLDAIRTTNNNGGSKGTDGSEGTMAEPSGLHGTTESSEDEGNYGYPV